MKYTVLVIVLLREEIELSTLEVKKESQIRINYEAIDEIYKKMAEKAGISIEKAKTKLGMGIIL